MPEDRRYPGKSEALRLARMILSKDVGALRSLADHNSEIMQDWLTELSRSEQEAKWELAQLTEAMTRIAVSRGGSTGRKNLEKASRNSVA
jgi:hypothetical protein